MKTIYSVQSYRASIIRDVIFFILGLILAIYQSAIIENCVRFVGAAIVLVSGISAYKLIKMNVNKSQSIIWIGVVAALLFGLFIFFMPQVFTGFLAVLFGLLLLWGGTLQLITLIKALKWTSFNFVSFFFPLLNVAIGVAMVFATQSFIDSSMWLVGLAMIFYAVTDFVTQYSMYKKYGELEVQQAESSKTAAKPEVIEQTVDSSVESTQK